MPRSTPRNRATLGASTALQAAALVLLTAPASAGTAAPRPGMPPFSAGALHSVLPPRNGPAPISAGLSLKPDAAGAARDAMVPGGRTMRIDGSGRLVTATSVSRDDFLAGRIVITKTGGQTWSQTGQTGHAVSNAGAITLRQAGLSRLVSPQAANAGLMNAKLGRVVLGGAPVDTLDMYGDGLVALNVTRQVTQVQLGQHAVPGLVTNIGTLLAPGGTVALTARAADGLVNSLVSSGRNAASGAKSASRVLVSGIGGDVEVETAPAAGLAAVPGGKAVLGGMSHPPQTPHLQFAHLQLAAVQAGLRLAGNTVRTQAAPPSHAPPSKTAPSKTAPSRQAAATHSAFDATGTLTVADSCTGLENCLSFANFLADGSTIVDSNGAIIFAPGTLPPSQTLTSGAAIVLTTTLGGHSSASGDIVFDNGLSLFAPSFTLNAAGSVFLNGVAAGSPIAPTALVQVTAGGDITEHMPGGQQLGSINAQALTVTAGGSVTLDNAANTVGTLNGAAAPNGSFTFTDANGLSVTAPLTAGGEISITVTGAGNGLTSSASIAAPSVALSAATLDMSGAIVTPLLAAQANAGSAAFTSSANMISSIGTVAGLAGLQATGGITLADAESLSLNGPVASPGQAVGIALTGAASSLTGTGAITAAQLDLSAAGSINLQGAVTAGLLTADAGGSIALTAATNAISSIGSDSVFAGVMAGGAITVSDATALALDGPITVSGQTIAVTVTGSGNALSGAGAVTGGAVALSAAGSIALTGLLTAGTLAAEAATAITLTDTSIGTIGTVGSLSGLQAGTGITVTDTQSLAITGPVSATAGTVMVAVTGTDNGLTITGPLTAPILALSATGSLAVTGAVNAKILAATAGTNLAFTSASNTIGTIGTAGALSGLQSAGALTLDDAAALSIAAPVMATDGDILIAVTGAGNTLSTSAAITGNTIAMSAAGGIALGASVDAGTFGLALSAARAALLQAAT